MNHLHYAILGQTISPLVQFQHGVFDADKGLPIKDAHHLASLMGTNHVRGVWRLVYIDHPLCHWQLADKPASLEEALEFLSSTGPHQPPLPFPVLVLHG